MSAWIVSKFHIDCLMKAYLKYKSKHGATFRENLSDVGQLLVDQNYRSVNYRYGTTQKPYMYVASSQVRLLRPVEIIKAVHCLRYQSCETPGWKRTKAYKILDDIEALAIEELPGYEKAPWGLEK